MRLVLQRVGLAVAVAGIAVLCLSSAWLAAAIGVITAAIVAVDMIAFARPPRPPTPPAAKPPETISVDLSRRP
jgi:predicted acyltransferase